MIHIINFFSIMKSIRMKSIRKYKSKSSKSTTQIGDNNNHQLSNSYERGGIQEGKKFPQFNDLSDDIQLLVLSFVADAPFKFNGDTLTKEDYHSTLTHVLPFVSRHFLSLVRSKQADVFFWREVLLRRIQKEPFLWKEGLRRLISEFEPPSSHATTILNDDTCSIDLFNYVYDLVASRSQSEKIYQNIFKDILTNHIRYSGPVFIMPGEVRLNHVFGLHLFEPRYRLMIQEVMANSPCTNGENITDNNPTFIYANRLSKRSSAVIVQVRNCMIHSNGRADVELIPSAYVWLEDAWIRSNTRNLYHARTIRMTRRASLALDAL